MHKKYIWLLLFVGATITSLFGQKDSASQLSPKSWTFPYDAVVHMEDGTIFNCSVIKDADKVLSVVLSYGDTLTLDYDNIGRCERTSTNGDRIPAYTSPKSKSYSQKDRRKRRRLTGRLSKMPIDAFIKMEDGSRFSRTIVEDDTYMLTTVDAGGDTSYLHYPDIDKVTKKLKNATYYENATFHYDKGTFFRGSLASSFSDINGYTGVDLIAGLRLNKKWAIGLGLSYEFFGQNFGGINHEVFALTNLFAYGRYNLTDKKTRFFVAAKVGHTLAELDIDFRNDYNAGINVAPSVGFTIASRKNLRLTVEAGMATQWVQGNYTTQEWWGQNQPIIRSEYKSLMSRPFLKLGLDFQ